MKSVDSLSYGPERLAICRILTCAMLLYFYSMMDYTPYCMLPSEFWDPISLFKYLHIPRLSSHWIIALQIIFIGSLGLCVVGLAVRTGALLALFTSTYLFGFVNCFGKVNHDATIIPFLLLIIATSRSADAFTIWPRPRGKHDQVLAAQEDDYTWPIVATWVLFGIVFGAAGIAKLRYGGGDWIFSNNMSRILRLHYLSASPPTTDLAHWIADSSVISSTLAAAAIVLETLAPLAVFSRIARIMIVPSLALMLVGFYFLLGFAPYQYSILFVWFIPFDYLYRQCKAKESQESEPTEQFRPLPAVT